MSLKNGGQSLMVAHDPIKNNQHKLRSRIMKQKTRLINQPVRLEAIRREVIKRKPD
jgi:hypothetical protein